MSLSVWYPSICYSQLFFPLFVSLASCDHFKTSFTLKFICNSSFHISLYMGDSFRLESRKVQGKLRELLIISHDHMCIDKFDIRRNSVVQRNPISMMTSPIGECVFIVLLCTSWSGFHPKLLCIGSIKPSHACQNKYYLLSVSLAPWPFRAPVFFFLKLLGGVFPYNLRLTPKVVSGRYTITLIEFVFSYQN